MGFSLLERLSYRQSYLEYTDFQGFFHDCTYFVLRGRNTFKIHGNIRQSCGITQEYLKKEKDSERCRLGSVSSVSYLSALRIRSQS
jgi:hypothetical protein